MKYGAYARFVCLFALVFACLLISPSLAVQEQKLSVSSEAELLQVLDLAQESPETVFDLVLDGEVELFSHAVLPENVRLSMEEGTVLRIVGAEAKLTNNGGIQGSGAIEVLEKGRLLNYGWIRLDEGVCRVFGQLKCYMGSELHLKELSVAPSGQWSWRAGARISVETPVKNEGRIRGEGLIDGVDKLLIHSLPGSSCRGIALDAMEGTFTPSSLDQLLVIVREAERCPERQYSVEPQHSLRLREMLCLPPNLTLCLRKNVEVNKGSALIAYGGIKFTSPEARLIVHEGGSALISGETDENALVWEEGSIRLAAASLMVTPPDKRSYDADSDSAWDTAGGVVTPVTADGTKLPSVPLRAEMIGAFALPKGGLGDVQVDVSFCGITQAQAYFVRFERRLSPQQAQEEGFLLLPESGEEEITIVLCAPDAQQQTRLELAAQRLAEEEKAQLAGLDAYAVALEKEGVRLPDDEPVLLRLYPEQLSDTESIWLIRLLPDGGTETAKLNWNGRSGSASLNGVGCLAVCTLKGEAAEDAQKQEGTPDHTAMPAASLAPKPTATPAPSAFAPQTPAPAIETESAAKDEENPLAQSYGLAIGAIFVLLAAAALVITLRANR